MERDIIVIDEEKCNGCGACVPECHEGALQIIDGKARLVSDLFCDGLGACIGHCPEGAMRIEKREAEPYDEVKVMDIMVTKGENTIRAHLNHLKGHGEQELLDQALDYLTNISFEMDLSEFTGEKQRTKEIVHDLFGKHSNSGLSGGCPGSKPMELNSDREQINEPGSVSNTKISSELRQWPVQMHLLNPGANYFRNADVLLAADCVAYSVGDFHHKYLRGKTLAIACPKLDSNIDLYIEKLTAMIDQSKINTLTVMRMEVPCCGGLLEIARTALSGATRNIPIKELVVSIQGDILDETWI